VTTLLIPPRIRQALRTTELRYPANAIVVLAGIPGSGKSTLLRRLFPKPNGVRVLDSEPIRNRWRPVLRNLPYAVWRPALHLTYYVRVLRAMRTNNPLVIHDCATKPMARQLIGRAAQLADRPVHLLMLDVPADLARQGQSNRGRIVRPGSMETHARRWPVLRDLAATAPARIVPGAVSAVILTRDQADQLARITFAAEGQ
jgi:energy-coupling factor transporter ATP-binding protein EcfA2